MCHRPIGIKEDTETKKIAKVKKNMTKKKTMKKIRCLSKMIFSKISKNLRMRLIIVEKLKRRRIDGEKRNRKKKNVKVKKSLEKHCYRRNSCKIGRRRFQRI